MGAGWWFFEYNCMRPVMQTNGGRSSPPHPLLVPLRAQAALQQKPADQSPASRQAAAQYLKESSKRSQSHAFYTWSWSLGIRPVYFQDNMKYEIPLSTTMNTIIESCFFMFDVMDCK